MKKDIAIAILLVTYWLGVLLATYIPIKNSPNSVIILAIIGVVWSLAVPLLTKDNERKN